jgi:hypothetical protein
MKAHEILDSPEKWSQGAWARTAEGHTCDVTDCKAAKFSLKGALIKAHHSNFMFEKFKRVLRRLGGKSLTEWNDAKGRTFQQVRRLLLREDL